MPPGGFDKMLRNPSVRYSLDVPFEFRLVLARYL